MSEAVTASSWIGAMPAIDVVFTFMITLCGIGWLISTLEYFVVAKQFVSGMARWHGDRQSLRHVLLR